MRGGARRGAPPGKGRWGGGAAARSGGGCPGAAGRGSPVTLSAPPTFQGSATSPAAAGGTSPRWSPVPAAAGPRPGLRAPGPPPPGAALAGRGAAALAPGTRRRDRAAAKLGLLLGEELPSGTSKSPVAPGRPDALPGRVSHASRRSKCPSICCQTLKWSDKPAVRTRAGEQTSQRGVEARHGMEQPSGRAARFQVRAGDAAVGWVRCKESVSRW